MTKEAPPKRRGPGRPSKGKVQATFRLSPGVVDALSRAHEETGRDKSDLAEQAIVKFLRRGTWKPQK
jgi:predicted transcriptional regulator